MRKLFVLGLTTLAFSVGLSAQTTKEEVFSDIYKAGGVYYAYPSANIQKQTKAPAGYKPFYLSHFGRHGSRYLISDEQYKGVIDVLAKAKSEGALTNLGSKLYADLLTLWKEVQYKGGDLSPLGVREQRGIAERMAKSYPEIFSKQVNIDACATMVVRCVLSMDAFSERLKELNPKLNITRESGMYHQRYLNHHTKEAIAFRSAPDTWREEYLKFEDEKMNPSRLVNSIFSDTEFIAKKVNPRNFMWGMYSITIGMQNVETDLDFTSFFEKQELFDIWQCENFKNYVNDANYAASKNLMFDNAKPVLREIIKKADQVIAENGKGASLKFAHDGNIIPLALLLHLDNTYNSIEDASDFYKVWSNFKVAPMAGNIQIVFYRSSKSDDVLVKFLLHENEVLIPEVKTDIAPYYRWSDIKNFYNSML